MRGSRPAIAKTRVKPSPAAVASITASFRQRSRAASGRVASTAKRSVPTISRYGSRWISERATCPCLFDELQARSGLVFGLAVAVGRRRWRTAGWVPRLSALEGEPVAGFLREDAGYGVHRDRD